jgi:hypothetical protein
MMYDVVLAKEVVRPRGLWVAMLENRCGRCQRPLEGKVLVFGRNEENDIFPLMILS